MSQRTSSVSASSRKKRRISPIRTFIRFSVFLILIASFMAGGILSYLAITSPVFRKTIIFAATGGLSPEKAFHNRDSLNVLLLGKDEDRDNRAQVMQTNGRTDAILLAHIDFKNNNINILSIPRDTLARIPGRVGRYKINGANQRGGPELASKTVENLVGVNVDYHVLVDYAVFERIIDRMGGIPINVDKELNYDDNWGNLHIHLKPGHQVLNGNQALGLVRFRHSNDGAADTDIERIARQQALLASAKSRMKHPRMLFRIPDIIEMALKDSKSTLTLQQTMCLANFARNIGHENIRMEVLPSTPAGSALRMDRAKACELVRELFYTDEKRASAERPNG